MNLVIYLPIYIFSAFLHSPGSAVIETQSSALYIVAYHDDLLCFLFSFPTISFHFHVLVLESRCRASLLLARVIARGAELHLF